MLLMVHFVFLLFLLLLKGDYYTMGDSGIKMSVSGEWLEREAGEDGFGAKV